MYVPRRSVSPTLAWNGRSGRYTKSQTINKLINPGQRQDPIHLNDRVFQALCHAGMKPHEVNVVLSKAEHARVVETMPGNIASSCVNVVLGIMSNVLKNAQLKRLKKVNTQEVATLMSQLNDALHHISTQKGRIEELEAQVKMDADEREFIDLMDSIDNDTACQAELSDLMCDEQPLSPPPSPPPSSPPLTHAQAISLAFAQEMFTDGYFN